MEIGKKIQDDSIGSSDLVSNLIADPLFIILDYSIHTRYYNFVFDSLDDSVFQVVYRPINNVWNENR